MPKATTLPICFGEMEDAAEVKVWVQDNPDSVIVKDKNDFTALWVVVDMDDLNVATWLMTKKKANVNCVCHGPGKLTPLHIASSAEMVRALLAHGANPALKDFYGCNALMQQVSDGELDNVAAILEHPLGRAIVNVQNPGGPQGWEGFTALHHACEPDFPEQPQEEMIGLLLEAGADPLIVDKQGYTPLGRLEKNTRDGEEHPAQALLQSAMKA